MWDQALAMPAGVTCLHARATLYLQVSSAILASESFVQISRGLTLMNFLFMFRIFPKNALRMVTCDPNHVGI